MESLVTFLHLDQFAWSDLWVVVMLVVLEGLLSCDNAVVLALLVKHLPPEARGRALRYGIVGAYVFRVIALILAVWIMSQWYLKVLGGLYLVYIGLKFFWSCKAEEEGAPPTPQVRRWFGLNPFWSTVVAVELTDIVFSVDSIAAAVALTDKLWVLILGACAGILVMRFAAQGFVRLLEAFPRLEACAFTAVAFIGFKLLCELPGDVVGLQHAFPAGTTYATAKQYHDAVDRHAPPIFAVAHTITINRASAPRPEAHHFTADAALIARVEAADPVQRLALIGESEAALSAAHNAARSATIGSVACTLPANAHREFEKARSDWNLHLRPLFEVEGWVSSIIVALIFGFGFLRPARPKPNEPA